MGNTNYTVSQIAFAKGQYIAAVDKRGADLGLLFSSADTKAWTQCSASGTPNPVLNLFNVTYGNDIFVAGGLWKSLFTSSDGNNWTGQTVTGFPTAGGFSFDFQSIAFGNGQFIAAMNIAPGYSTATNIASSPDGINWTLQPVDIPIQKVVWCSNRFLAVAKPANGTTKIFRSFQGTSPWTSFDTGTNKFLQSVTFGKGVYVLVGESGLIMTSTNSAGPWTQRTSGTSAWLYDVTYAAGVFVAVGDFGTILSSADGINWTSHASGVPGILTSVMYANGRFVVSGWGGKILQSDPLMNLAVTGSQLTAAGAPGVSLTIQGCSDLALTNWQNITNLTLSTNAATWSDPQSAVSPRFYRALLSP